MNNIHQESCKIGSYMRYNLFSETVHHTTHTIYKTHIFLLTSEKMMKPSLTCS